MAVSHSPRLLVVDDDLGVIAAYRIVLERSKECHAVENLFALDNLENELFGAAEPEQGPNWRVEFVDQGLDAVSAVKGAISDGDPFTAVFLDIRMPPGIDGCETARRIRQLDRNVHIVIVSGFSDYSNEELEKVAGPGRVLSFLPKPVWPEQLRRVATQVCSDAKSSLRMAV
jgi:CheY-like chemotaxis protein